MTKKEKFNIQRKARRDRRKAIILEATGDKSLASKLRDTPDKEIAKIIKGINLVDKKITYDNNYVSTKEVYIPVKVKETKSDRNKRKYKEAREAGYTPKEARDLRSLSQSNFDKMLQFNKVKNIGSRVQRWASMAKREDYDSWIHEEVERINLENGLDVNASFGWNAVYMYYTEGGTLEFWETYFVSDPLNQNIYKARTKTVWNTQTRARRLKF